MALLRTLGALARNIKSFAIRTSAIRTKQVREISADITDAVRRELRSGNDLLGQPLHPLRSSTRASLVTNDRRPNEMALGPRLSFGDAPMKATGATIEAIRVTIVGNEVVVDVRDPKAREILEMQRVPVLWRATREQNRHMPKMHGLKMKPGKTYSRVARELIPDMSEYMEVVRIRFAKDIERALRETL